MRIRVKLCDGSIYDGEPVPAKNIKIGDMVLVPAKIFYMEKDGVHVLNPSIMKKSDIVCRITEEHLEGDCPVCVKRYLRSSEPTSCDGFSCSGGESR